MKRIMNFVVVAMLIQGCGQGERTPDSNAVSTVSSNMEEVLSDLTWMNEPGSFDLDSGTLKILAKKGTDFFNSPEDSSIAGTAPYLYRAVEGDFVAKTLVQPDFSSQWNAVALMVYMDSLNWIKFAFENSDATGPSIVTVVTRGTSDDANGVILNETGKVWLALARKNNSYSLHWSVDGKTYKMARLTAMPDRKEVRIGIEAQCPVGEEAMHRIHYFEVEKRTVENLRAID